jgi:hypothetical protein
MWNEEERMCEYIGRVDWGGNWGRKEGRSEEGKRKKIKRKERKGKGRKGENKHEEIKDK